MKQQMILHGTLTGAASEVLRVSQEWGGSFFAFPPRELPAPATPRWTFHREMEDGQQFVCDLRLRGDGRVQALLAADAEFAGLVRTICDALAAMAYTRAAGPSDKTRLRAECFRKLKDAHPAWSRVQVAAAANRELSTDNLTEDSVKYAYSKMGWRWPKR